jgi:hypothetical protein
LNIVSRLQNEAWIIKLADIERYVDDSDLLLSPKAFPKGSILYNYSTSVPSSQQEQLSPFELFREPLLVLGLVDRQGDQDGVGEKELGKAAEYLRERHPRVVHRQLLMLEDGEGHSSVVEDNIIRVSNTGKQGDASLKVAVCKLSAKFLKELTTYTRAMQASPSIPTPGQTARSLQRTTSQREHEKRPSSGHSTPTKSIEAASPVDDTGSSPPSLNRGSPATSFDQIPSANGVPSGVSKPDSRTSSKSKHTRRASSQDRVSVQGFGSGTSQDKLKQRGKARVGIITGSIYMTAGQWSEALRILVEHTNKARILSDHIWHAKGLENIIVCLLLHSWAGLEFQIPSICYPVADRSSSQRFSVNLPSDFKPGDAAQVASVRRLSTSLPDLLKLVLSLYRSVEGSLELPFVCISEATVRFSKLLAVLLIANGELDHSTLDHFIRSTAKNNTTSNPPTARSGTGSLSKTAVADMLSHAQPANEDSIQITDQVAILAGTASVYALLGMNRKKANTLKDLVVKLTSALTQARKRGAAEMGIHPAASLSAETGADTILAATEDSEGVNKMMAEIARIYGIQLPASSANDEEIALTRTTFGNDNLKVRILRDMGAFCEATPDPYGVLRMTTAVLSSFGPNSAVDAKTDRYTGVLSKEDQVRLTTTIGRTIGVSKNLGLPQVEARYWDRFLVREVNFVPPSLSAAIIDRSKLKLGPATIESVATGGNPLLYDPNASRPGTAPESPKIHILVENDIAVCVVTLQNPYEISVDIESLSLVTEGVELNANHPPFTLYPMRVQQVSLSVLPSETGDSKITGVRVKISGCTEETFPIMSNASTPPIPMLVKDIGQESATSEALVQEQETSSERTTINAMVIESQPVLALEDTSLLESSIMLLDGERRELSVVVRNVSSIPLAIFDTVASHDTLRLQSTSNRESSATVVLSSSAAFSDVIVVEPGDRTKFNFVVTGKPNVSRAQVAFYYSHLQDGGHHARMLAMPVDMTVNAAIQVQHLNAVPLPGRDRVDSFGDSFVLSFDIRNAWPKPLAYVASILSKANEGSVEDSLPKQDGVLAPGEIQRVYLVMPYLIFASSSKVDIEKVRGVLLERLRVTWSGEGRAGEVDLSGLVLNPEAVEVVSKTYIHLDLQLISAHKPVVETAALSVPTVKVGSFITLRVKVAAPRGAAELLCVQLHAHSANSVDATHDERRVAIAGATNRIVRLSPEGKTGTVDFAVCPLLAGAVELEVTTKAALVKGNSMYQGTSRGSLRLRVA